MPMTAYHFGLHGFIGLLFKKWLDIPVLILANVIIDVEVLFHSKYIPGDPLTHWHYAHRVFYFHTLLIGGLVGLAFGLSLFPLKKLFGKIMEFFRLSYKPTLLKMGISGLLGAWLHVVVDGIYHRDVQMFWPNTNYNPLRNIISRQAVRIYCLYFWIAALGLYVIILLYSLRKRNNISAETRNGKETS
jgi:membrane-bound metal-dependent hydrolase YbcI (DUF457 family)